MLRIAYLISRYPAVSHTFILREIRQLRALGVEISPISVNRPDRPNAALSEVEREEAATTVCLKSKSVGEMIVTACRTMIRRPAGLWAGAKLALRLGGLDVRAIGLRFCYLAEGILVGDHLEQQNLTHLHVHFATPAATVAMFVKEIFGVPFSMTVHGPDEFYDVSVHHLSEKIAAASFICTIGSFCRSQLMKLSDPEHWPKLEVAPLGVDPQIFRPRSVLRMRQNGPFRILCLGRLVPAKGQTVLLEAVAVLARSGSNVRVVFGGDGPDRSRLETMAVDKGVSDHVTFLGVVNPDCVPDLYAEADAFVLPSFAEGIPVVLMEAMAMELPCISTAVNGIPELITSGESGLLVSPSDVGMLADAIAKLIADGVLRHALGAAGRKKVIASYDLSRSVYRLSSIFIRRIGGVCEARRAA